MTYNFMQKIKDNEFSWKEDVCQTFKDAAKYTGISYLVRIFKKEKKERSTEEIFDSMICLTQKLRVGVEGFDEDAPGKAKCVEAIIGLEADIRHFASVGYKLDALERKFDNINQELAIYYPRP